MASQASLLLSGSSGSQSWIQRKFSVGLGYQGGLGNVALFVGYYSSEQISPKSPILSKGLRGSSNLML